MEGQELKLKLLEKVIEINTERSIEVAKLLLNFDEKEYPVRFVYEFKTNFSYHNFSLSAFVQLYDWFKEIDGEEAEKDFFNATNKQIEFWINLKTSRIQNLFKEYAIKAAWDLELGKPNLKINLKK